MYENVMGIVLKSVNYRENDRMLTLFAGKGDALRPGQRMQEAGREPEGGFRFVLLL